jgi:hypothetical protein
MERDMNVLDDFCAVTNRIYQNDLAEAVQNLTRQGLMYGYEIEDIIACLAYMVEAEAEVVADEFEDAAYAKWQSEQINQGLGLDNLQRRHR